MGRRCRYAEAAITSASWRAPTRWIRPRTSSEDRDDPVLVSLALFDQHFEDSVPQHGCACFSPLDSSDRSVVDQLEKPEVDHLGQMIEPVEVRVEEPPHGSVNGALEHAHEGECGARHGSRHSEAGSEPLDEGCLARSEVAFHEKHVTGCKALRELAAEIGSGLRARHRARGEMDGAHLLGARRRGRRGRRGRGGQQSLGPYEIRTHLGNDLGTATKCGGGVVCRYEVASAIRIGPAAKPAYALIGAEQQPRREVPERDDHGRIDQFELRFEPRTARLDLGGKRVAVVRRPALDHVRDVAGGPVHADLLPHELVEKLAGPADKRLACQVLVPAGAFAHEHQLGSRVADSEHDLSAPGRKRTFRARQRDVTDLDEGPHGWSLRPSAHLADMLLEEAVELSAPLEHRHVAAARKLHEACIRKATLEAPRVPRWG